VRARARKTLRNKKAISPILATLLLIVIAVAAIAVTYAWIMAYTGHLFGQAGVLLKEANVKFYGNGTSIDIDVLNAGTSDTTITQVYIGTSSSTMDNQTITPLNLAAGATQRETVSYDWSMSTTYYFKIITSSGQELSFQEEAPSSYS
jgi:flagellin-like protein